MEIRRNLQLGATAVIVNGLLALTVLTPKLAHASCSTWTPCVNACSNPAVQCLPTFEGCTFTSGVCTGVICETGIPAHPTGTKLSCNYG